MASICGKAKEGGKTHLALTFPEPIYYINLDQGMQELLKNFLDKQIFEVRVHAETSLLVNSLDDFLSNEYKEMMAAYREALEALRKIEAGTIIFDTFTQARSLITHYWLSKIRKERVASGGRDETFQYDYEDANNDTGGIIRDVYDVPGVNLVLVHRAAPVYDNKGNDLGTVKIQGWHGVAPAVGHILYTGRNAKGEFYAKIEGSRSGSEFMGMTIENPTYDKLIALGLGAVE